MEKITMSEQAVWQVRTLPYAPGLVACGIDAKENIGEHANSNGTYSAIRLGLREMDTIGKEMII
jgi:hypothetical protein